MKYKTKRHGWNVFGTRFAPYEDVLGLVHEQGYSSIIVPGSGLATFDAFEANPFETSKQRRERTVHGLLEKLDPSTFEKRAGEHGVTVQRIGAVGGAQLNIANRLSCSMGELRRAWERLDK